MLAGQAAGRSSAAQVTVFDSVRFALEDHAALTWRGEAAAAQGIGDGVPLVPLAVDPKNLFGLLNLQPVVAAAQPAGKAVAALV